MTMDLDNPSYFSVPKEIHPHSQDITDSSSECSLTRQSPPKGSKLSLRTFLRSFSTTSADSNQELLILGEPRLSDIAPDLAFKHPSRSGSFRSRTEDIIYQEESGDEVFIAEDVARYYNSPVKASQRRHSIGTFMGRERSGSASSSTKSFKEDGSKAIVHATSNGEVVGSVISFEEHSVRHAAFPKKNCPVCTRGRVKKAHSMDDIVIVSLKCSEAAALWVQYFTTYFETISKQVNRKPFKIQTISLEDCLKLNPDEDFEKNKYVKLQLVVLCPGFLEFITEYPGKCGNLGRMFLPDRCLALLLGVSDNDITSLHKKIFPTYFQWQRLSVGQDQDENFAKEFLGQAMSILSRVWKQQTSNQEKPLFSVSPKKIRQGQNTVFILLANPLQKEDVVKVSLERNGELFEVKTVKRRNPYTIKISVPENLTEITSIVNVLLEKNGNIIGNRPIKCESKLRELEQILRLANNPVEFMCQTLGFSPSNRDQLDNWLLQGFLKNMPPHFNLLANHDTPFAAAVHAHKHSHEEYPTLLHFAAKFGLEKFTLQLLECPGAEMAYDIRNVCDLTPADIAEINGHPNLASTLRGYMNMNEFSSTYAKLKEISSRVSDTGNTLATTSKTKSIDDLYKVCPPPRPVHLDPLPIVVTPASECTTPTSSQGYMSMRTPPSQLQLDEIRDEMREKEEFLQQITDQVALKLAAKNKSSSKSKNQLNEDKVQKELLEIINDFKNNVHSISQVEQLVDEWKKRNDVQKSFKEKQEQLHLMRLQYEKIQQEMKASMKKPTPFERFLKLFGKNKADELKKPELASPTTAVSTSPSIILVNSTRPISSLSTSSSGSSGRMSTISGSSLGDSGTHSDNEERKSSHGNNEDEFRVSALNKAVLELNYTVVPAPKPVKAGILGNRKLFETIEERPTGTRPDTLPLNTNEYYIKFPSNRPVIEPPQKTPIHAEYVNVSVEAESNSKQHEYMNVKANR